MEEKDKSKRQCEGENGVEGNQKNDLVIGLRDNVVVSLMHHCTRQFAFFIIASYNCVGEVHRGDVKEWGAV
jgi:hypothetical protein